MGLHRAGFEVVGVDIEPQPNFPFEFHRADAMTFDLSGYDLIWSSPPCQAYSVLNNIWDRAETYPDLVEPTRNRLIQTGLPYVIENVPGAPLIEPLKLCGEMFGLRVIRHRIFEVNPFILAPKHQQHTRRAAYGRVPKNDEHYTVTGHFGDLPGASKAMGIDWMTKTELAQAIPPAYSEFLGRQVAAMIGAIE